MASCVRLRARSGGEAFFCLLCAFLSSSGGEEAARQYTAIAMILKSRAHTATRKFRRRGRYGSISFTKLHDAQMTVHTLTNTQPFSLVEVRALQGVCPWLAMLIDNLTCTTDAYQLTRLRMAGRPTGLLFTNDRCSLIYMNGCEL